MKLVRPQCRTPYDVTPAALGSEGRQVRCARCQGIWFAEPPEPAANVIQLAAHDARTAPLAGVVGTAPAAAAPDLAPMWPEPAAVAASPVRDAPAVPEIAAAAVSLETPPAAPAPTAAADGLPAVIAVPPEGAAAAAAPELEQAAPALEPPPKEDIESVAARRIAARRPVQRPQRAGWPVRKLVAAAVALAVIDAGLIVGRADVVRALPQTASLYETIGLPVNLRDLAFEDVKTTQETHDGVSILAIEGTIVAVGRAVADVPRLRFAVGAANGHEIYAWTALPTRTKLAPGETLAFRTRLASPPEQGRSVKIRFFTRLDLASGLR